MQKKNYRFLKFIDNSIDRIVTLIFLIFFLVGSYGLVDTYSVYNASQDKGLLKFKPEAGETLKPDVTGNVAWLTLDDSTVDYPIMQGETNETYLDRDPYGQYALSGSIFLDYRNSPNFVDSYNLVYGHHMEKGLMFGCLDSWLDQDWFDSHRTGHITTANRIYDLKVFAVCEERASVNELFQPTDVDPSETFDFIKEHAVILDRSVEPAHVVALSTCKYPDTDDRTIIMCEMVQTYEGDNIDLDETKHQTLSVSDTQTGTKIYKNIQPKTVKKDWFDKFVEWAFKEER